MIPIMPIMKFEYETPSTETDLVYLKYVVFLADMRKYPKVFEKYYETNDISVLNQCVEANRNELINSKNVIAAFGSKRYAEEFCQNYDIPSKDGAKFYVTYVKLEDTK